MPTFDSAQLKIERAQRQTNELYKEAVELLGPGDHPGYRINFERDADPRKWRAIFRLLKKPPDDWPVRLGEIIHDLRSALDHLVYEASALDENGVPLTGTEFPIFVDEELFRERAPYRIRGLNDATRAFVTEKCQPFTNTDPEIIPYPSLLHQLSNTDKHRLLNFITVPHALDRLNVLYQSASGQPLKRSHIATGAKITEGQRLKDGAEFFSFWTKEPLPADTKVSMDTHITIDIAFDETTPIANGLPVFKTIEGIGRLVGGIRNEFIKLNPDPR